MQLIISPKLVRAGRGERRAPFYMAIFAEYACTNSLAGEASF